MNGLTITLITLTIMLVFTGCFAILVFGDILRSSWKGLKPTLVGLLCTQLFAISIVAGMQFWPEISSSGKRGQTFTSDKSCDAPDRPYWCDM